MVASVVRGGGAEAAAAEAAVKIFAAAGVGRGPADRVEARGRRGQDRLERRRRRRGHVRRCVRKTAVETVADVGVAEHRLQVVGYWKKREEELIIKPSQARKSWLFNT